LYPSPKKNKQEYHVIGGLNRSYIDAMDSKHIIDVRTSEKATKQS